MAEWLLVLGMAFGVGAAYLAWKGIWVEPKQLTVERYILTLERLPEPLDGLTIAFLTDLHLLPSGFGVEIAEWAVIRANEANPDIVALGGDLVHWCGAVPHLIPVLRRLKSRYGIFAVLGNHDHHCPWRLKKPSPWGGKPLSVEEWRIALERANVRLLVNEAVRLEINGATLWLVGVDDPYTGRDNLKGALSEVPQDAFAILIAHSPDIVDDPNISRVALVLSGHTHGGQIVFPLLGPILAPCRDKFRRAQGLSRVNGTWLYVSRGISAGLPIRLRCPPEVSVLTLKASPKRG
ncbi:metallophosphoesterase [Fervidibacter sacchari]